MSNEHLSIDIYTDKYPKPKLIDDGLPDVIVVNDTIIIPDVLNSPTHINSPHIETPEKTPENIAINDNEVIVYNNKVLCRTILCMFIFICMGVVCVIIALDALISQTGTK